MAGYLTAFTAKVQILFKRLAPDLFDNSVDANEMRCPYAPSATHTVRSFFAAYEGGQLTKHAKPFQHEQDARELTAVGDRHRRCRSPQRSFSIFRPDFGLSSYPSDYHVTPSVNTHTGRAVYNSSCPTTATSASECFSACYVGALHQTDGKYL